MAHEGALALHEGVSDSDEKDEEDNNDDQADEPGDVQPDEPGDDNDFSPREQVSRNSIVY